MNIAITATGPSLEVEVDPRFGRCPYFLILDADNLYFESIENPNAALGGGAGVQAARLMVEKGVKSVLTGDCGRNASEALRAAGIDVILGCSGTARDVVEQFRTGQLKAADEPNVVIRFDTTSAPDPRPGQLVTPQQPPMSRGRQRRGRGRRRAAGMGHGMRRGMSQGRGRGRGMR